MSDVIPDGWRVHALDGYVDILSGYPFSSSLFSDDSRRIGLIRIRDLEAQRVATFYEGEFDDTYIVRQGDVLIGMDGDFSIVKWRARSALLNQRICKIKASDGGEFFTDFLYHSLISDLQKIHSETGATTVKHLSVKDIRAIKNYYPPLSEQKKIANILSSVDNVIEKTNSQIEKMKDLKTGMMQKLLTKGIGHTEFKDSPIGKIPKIWSMIKVKELLADTKYALRSGPFGSALLKSELVHSGIPLLGIDNVHVEELRSVFKRFVSNEKFQELRKYRVFPNDVMVTIMGTVGRCCVVPEDFGIALSSKHVWTLSLDKEKYFPELLCWQINFSEWVKKQFINESQGGVMESISSSTLKGLMVPVPPIEEQKKIVDVHKSLSKRIMRKNDQLRTLIDLKKALMQDLLTGKVRVKVDSPETVAA